MTKMYAPLLRCVLSPADGTLRAAGTGEGFFFFFFSFAISRQVGGIYLGYKSGWLSKLHFLSTQLVSKPKGSLFQLSATLSLNLGLGATTSMSFKLEALEVNISFDDCFTAPRWIVGKGQRIYWKSCFVRVYASNDKHKTVATHAICDGQGEVPEGTEVFLGGKSGLVKE